MTCLPRRRFCRLLLLTVIAVCISSCASTLAFRDIQKEFNRAVQTDNLQTFDSLKALSGSSETGYHEVQAKLTDAYIQSLDPRLKYNAYAMKAVSQWRTGRLDEAMNTVQEAEGQSGLPPSPRDQMVLAIVPALIIDQRLFLKYQSLPGSKWLRVQDYQEFEKNYCQAAKYLQRADGLVTPELPPEVMSYVSYQRWRVLNNWNTVIHHLYDGKDFLSKESAKVQQTAIDDTQKCLKGITLPEAIAKAKTTIPPGDQLRQLLEAQSKT